MGIGLLSADVLLPILEILQGDRRTVYNCSLVNHAFNVPASKILYSRVAVSPLARLGIDLKDEGLSVRALYIISVDDTEMRRLVELGAAHFCVSASLCTPRSSSPSHW